MELSTKYCFVGRGYDYDDVSVSFQENPVNLQ